ncbi:MAG: response regulator transcription factor [Christensenellaceae bacterium]|jgi:DNA-binding response OmpR family regulator
MTDKKAVVLLVEDNIKILDANERVFLSEGYEVATATSLAQARAALEKVHPDVIVLDIMLPDGSGLDYIAEIRQKTTAPVLLLTALGDKDDLLYGLRAGGDDYIAKPYDIDELVARAGAAIRRDRMIRRAPAQAYERGPLRMDTISGQAFLSGEDMLLTQKEFALLLLMAQNSGRMIPAEELYECVWNQPMAGNDHSVKNAIYRLRKKLAGSGLSIRAERGAGYCFENPANK